MRYITATIGEIFIFVGVFILSTFVVAMLPPIFSTPIHLGVFYTNNIFGVILGLLAAAGSFRATLRRYARPAAVKKTQ